MKIEASLLWLHLRPVESQSSSHMARGEDLLLEVHWFEIRKPCFKSQFCHFSAIRILATYLHFLHLGCSHLTGMIISMWSMEHDVNVKLLFSRSVLSDSLRPHGLQPSRLLCPWNSPGRNIGVGCHFLLQGIFLMQGSNLCLLHCRWILYPLSHQFKLIHMKMNSLFFLVT